MTAGADEPVHIQYISEEELDLRIHRWEVHLDIVFPEWRGQVAECCIGCTDAPSPDALNTLESLDMAYWLRHGKGL